MSRRPAWLPDAAIGLIVAVFGAWEAVFAHFYPFGGDDLGLRSLATRGVIAVFIGAAAGLYRLAPGFALALVWLGCTIQILSSTDIMYAQLGGSMVVAYGCARWGRTALVWLSGLCIPIGALAAAAWVMTHGTALGDVLFYEVFRAAPPAGPGVTAGALAFLGFVALALPWLAGLVYRVREQARRSREQEKQAVASQQQAEEIAALRAEQTRMAHDVHDVVGHSLAVILAQAESAQFLPEDDPGRMKETMANIAVSARQSLRDVRQVLSATEVPEQQDGGLDKLIEGVRAAGNDVRSTVMGTPRPLPPEIDVVAYRTLQEMLTNAIKHGIRGGEVTVMRHWAAELTLAVQNPASTDATVQEGLGLGGMRMRLESVGGRLDVRHEGDSFTATAWLPLRHGMLGP